MAVNCASIGGSGEGDRGARGDRRCFETNAESAQRGEGSRFEAGPTIAGSSCCGRSIFPPCRRSALHRSIARTREAVEEEVRFGLRIGPLRKRCHDRGGGQSAEEATALAVSPATCRDSSICGSTTAILLEAVEHLTAGAPRQDSDAYFFCGDQKLADVVREFEIASWD